MIPGITAGEGESAGVTGGKLGEREEPSPSILGVSCWRCRFGILGKDTPLYRGRYNYEVREWRKLAVSPRAPPAGRIEHCYTLETPSELLLSGGVLVPRIIPFAEGRLGRDSRRD